MSLSKAIQSRVDIFRQVLEKTHEATVATNPVEYYAFKGAMNHLDYSIRLLSKEPFINQPEAPELVAELQKLHQRFNVG